jgi:hypothetical protein
LWLFFSIFGSIAHAAHQIIHKARPGWHQTFRMEKTERKKQTDIQCCQSGLSDLRQLAQTEFIKLFDSILTFYSQEGPRSDELTCINIQPAKKKSLLLADKNNILWNRRVWCKLLRVRARDVVFNVTFNNISATSWWSVLLVKETREHWENHRPATSRWQTFSHNVVSRNTSSWVGF